MSSLEPTGVMVNLSEIYQLLQSLDAKVTAVVPVAEALATTSRDHEERIRDIEAREDLTRRMTAVEASLENIKVRLYALPSVAGVAAVVAIAVAIAR